MGPLDGNHPAIIPPWVHGKHLFRYLPDWRQRYLCVDWPLVIACVVSPGDTVEGRWFPAGSIVIVDALTITKPEDVPAFAKRNRVAPFGFSTQPLPQLRDVAHLVVPKGFNEAAQERAGAMLAAAGTDAPALYVSWRCASLVAAMLGLAVSV